MTAAPQQLAESLDSAMKYSHLPGFDVHVSGGVATVTLDHPPLNLMNGVLLGSLRGFIHRIRDDSDVRVVAIDSIGRRNTSHQHNLEVLHHAN